MDPASPATEGIKLEVAIASSQLSSSHLIWVAAYGTPRATSALNAQIDTSSMVRNAALSQINAEPGMLQELVQVAMTVMIS